MMMARVVVMSVSAGVGIIGCDYDRRGGGNKSEEACSRNTRGSQGGAKHELPRPNFCLDHRFVRPNYARLPDVSLPNGAIPAGIGPGIAAPTAILAKRLYAKDFSAARPVARTML